MIAADVPLCVDLEGTLSPVNLLHEGLLSLIRTSPVSLLSLPSWRHQGKRHFEREIAARTQCDAGGLPLHAALLEWLKEQRQGGRRLVLVSAADPGLANDLGAKLGLFDDIIASPGGRSLSAEDRRDMLVARFGEGGFDYAGNYETSDAVFASARRGVVVGSDRQLQRAQGRPEVERTFRLRGATPAAWLKAIRVHQWAKNGLIFLPAILAHQILHAPVFIASALAFLSFSLCASSIYLVNDLFDLASDRRHPRKRHRPFASGVLPVRSGVVVSLALLVASVALAATVGMRFAGVLCAYYAVTWAYSLRLKRAALVDVMTLASLYTVRIIAGAAATLITPSFWLLGFSIFIFLSLALVKRYTEIHEAAQQGVSSVHGRGYSSLDLPLLLNLGVAAGYCTVVVMALYINSRDAILLYHRTQPLWLICPLLLYWVSRIWLLTTRGQMPDDPVVFALRDRISLFVFALVVLIVLLSI